MKYNSTNFKIFKAELENLCNRHSININEARRFTNLILNYRRKMELSIVIPVYNEETNIQTLVERLAKIVSAITNNYEIIFIDDGSTDSTANCILEEQKRFPNIVLLKLSRNFGQHNAAQAGFDYCRGEAVVWMDADLQEPPEEIPKLLDKLKEGYDLVYGLRSSLGGSLFKRVVSLSFVWVFNKLTKNSLPANACTFRVMSKRFVQNINKLPERVRFLAGINSWIGFKRAGVEIRYMPREGGKSKYTLSRMVKMSIDGLLSFSIMPLRLVTIFGFIVAGVAFIDMLHLILNKIFGIMIGKGLGWAPTLVAIYFLGGIQCIFLGLIGEYIGRIYLEVKLRPHYIIERCYLMEVENGNSLGNNSKG